MCNIFFNLRSNINLQLSEKNHQLSTLQLFMVNKPQRAHNIATNAAFVAEKA